MNLHAKNVVRPKDSFLDLPASILRHLHIFKDSMPNTRNSNLQRDPLGIYTRTCGPVIHDDLDVCTTVYNAEKGKR